MSTSTGIRTDVAIDPRTTVGTVRLTVRDLARSRAFYERAMGLAPVELDDGDVALGVAAGRHPLVELRGDSSAPALDRALHRPVSSRRAGAVPAWSWRWR